MSSAKDCYLALVADLQLFLLQDYLPKEWIATDSDNFHYFKTQAASAPKVHNPVAPIPPPPSAPSTPLYPRKPLPFKAPAPPPAPVVEIKQEPSQKEPKPFGKEPLGKAAAADLSEMRKLVAEKHPKWEMLEPPPYREKGAAVIVLASKEETLLLSIAQAIQNQLASVQVIDLELLDMKIFERPSLRLIVLEEITLRKNPLLLKHYHPQLGVIGKAPVVVLTDIAQLAHDSQRKRAVWNNIKEKLA